ncbi:MAG TPA: GNAT family N-acetyltransferase [Chitinophagales bacterium]|nr:GNAT family N-acetyltransferase [Chitinophagales bacterium]
MNLLTFSENESNKLNLKVYRANQINGFDHVNLLNEILDKKADVIRLKIPFDNNRTFEQIEKTAFPYNIFKSLIRMSVKKDAPKPEKQICNEIDFQKYDISKEDTLRILLKNSLNEPTEIGFTNSIYDAIIDTEKMIQLSTEYYIKLANEGEQLGNYFYLAYLEEQCIGFCSFQIRNNKSEGLFYTIAPSYRSKGMARELLAYARAQSFINGADEFSTNTIIQNPKSIYPQMKIGLVPRESYMNVIFFPLLSKKPAYQKEIEVYAETDIYNQTQTWLKEIGYDTSKLENTRTRRSESCTFPNQITLKIFMFNNRELIISAYNPDNTYWSYTTGTIN